MEFHEVLRTEQALSGGASSRHRCQQAAAPDERGCPTVRRGVPFCHHPGERGGSKHRGWIPEQVGKGIA